MTPKFAMIHHVDQKTIDEMYENYSPVFILSTGRSGSKFIAALLNNSSNVTAYHEPGPKLQYFSNFAFHNQDKEEVLRYMIDAARMELILDTYIKNDIYVESNQCLTFFAPVLAKLFKKSKFVHLIRHPGDFVRSAIRKGWHRNDSIWESGRVRMKDHTQWSQMGQVERLGRLWRVTNLYILNFKRKVKPERFITVKFEDLTANIEMAKKCILFCVSEEIDTDIILKAQNKKVNELHIHPYEPPNMKKDIEYLHFKEWDKTNKEKLKKLVGKLAHGFGYKL